MHITYYILLLALMLTGLFLNILGLPGLWLLVVAYVGYALATGWDVYVGWPSVTVVVLLALGAELVEFLAGAAGSAAAGGRKRGMVGAIVGGIVGGIVGTPILPVIGTIVGACAGAFIGAAAMEYLDKDAAHAMRVGIGAAKGRFWGIVWKTAFGLLMFLVAAFAGLPMSDGPTVTPASTLPPATTPTTTTSPSTLPIAPATAPAAPLP
ncbi:MAG: uncharacterized protein QOF78_1330 [Phycisphaerales bacterium]|jgi:uncharacterized protein YqgC (DUF456 family)|nr:uncharacterized protein [Phycisphaerales bacterium]MEA2736265.1 uncharacterized protein [Humisphaera sp.]